MIRTLLSFVVLFGLTAGCLAQEHSVARKWNEAQLFAIRNDFARPPVHARNLWHVSVAMYDAWAIYDQVAQPFLLGNEVGNYSSAVSPFELPADIEAAQNEAVAFAAYRVLSHRFQFSPNAATTLPYFDSLMTDLGYDPEFVGIDYSDGNPAALGNYIAQEVIAFGFSDGSNETGEYSNLVYLPENPPLDMTLPGNPDIDDPNRWQPLQLPLFIDQAGIPFTEAPPFQSPEWGNVTPFALDDSDLNVYTRDGQDWKVYLDPGPPPLIDTLGSRENDDLYRQGFALVSVWQSHLDPDDGVLWDISPASIGNLGELPTDINEMFELYDFFDGGDTGTGHEVNPHTGLPYEPQVVPRGDYARIVAEFWADGPDSETPPGHWYSILNYVTDHPEFSWKWKGEGDELPPLEYDVKAYFTLGGAVHDAAVAAWSVKGWFDYIRPVSAIRFMADRGQNTDPDLPSYHTGGIPLIDGLIELVYEGDELAGDENEHVGKIKLFTWRGPDYIEDPETDLAGVGWILAENWWPYQRPTFVTPPFAGYVSGHSTFSRAAAEVMTAITGDEYFPGGMSEFPAIQDEFLVFENGPSATMTLQWATYRDASDQCSLSRIWGGIHPPQDDIPGRLMGLFAGTKAFEKACTYFESNLPQIVELTPSVQAINADMGGETFTLTLSFDQAIDTEGTALFTFTPEDPTVEVFSNPIQAWEGDDVLTVSWEVTGFESEISEINISVSGLQNPDGLPLASNFFEQVFAVDMIPPQANDIVPAEAFINTASILQGFHFDVSFTEEMDPMIEPVLTVVEPEFDGFLEQVSSASVWLTGTQCRVFFTVEDMVFEQENLSFQITGAVDKAGNEMLIGTLPGGCIVDTRNPELIEVTPDPIDFAEVVGEVQWIIFTIEFDEAMDASIDPIVTWSSYQDAFTLDTDQSSWTSSDTYQLHYQATGPFGELQSIDLTISNAKDEAGNTFQSVFIENVFTVSQGSSIAESNRRIEATLAPNPVAVGQPVTLNFDAFTQGQIDIFSIEGKLMERLERLSGVRWVISTAHLSEGVYILRITDLEQHQTTKRLVMVQP